MDLVHICVEILAKVFFVTCKQLVVKSRRMTTVDGRRRWKSMLHLPEEASVVHQVPPLERVTINDPMSYSNL